MDQSLSIKNLNTILKEDREKGGDLEERYIPIAFKVRTKIYKLKKRRSLSNYLLRIGKITPDFLERRLLRLNKSIENRKYQHASIVDVELDRISKIISRKDFRINIRKLSTPISGKTVYGVDNNLEQIISMRFVQKTLKVLYEILMPSRDILVSQIKTLILDRVPKYVIRADVESFYESVRHKELLDKIHQSPELSVLIKRILTRLMKDYASISGSENGLPRGIGVSAYLSEIYLSTIDKEIYQQNDIFYYARYVDDMVLMYAPHRKDLINKYLENLSKTLNDKGLKFNDKTVTLNLLDEQKGKFEYLGYSFDASSSSLAIRLSQRKIEKYRHRLEKCFNDYSLKCSLIPQKASEELTLRCMFLTGNMRLFNRKSNAFIGVYFSNRHITDTSQLLGLDKFYMSKVNQISCPSLKRTLSKFSFEKGFKEKLFRGFDPKQLSNISQGWHHG